MEETNCPILPHANNITTVGTVYFYFLAKYKQYGFYPNKMPYPTEFIPQY